MFVARAAPPDVVILVFRARADRLLGYNVLVGPETAGVLGDDVGGAYIKDAGLDELANLLNNNRATALARPS